MKRVIIIGVNTEMTSVDDRDKTKWFPKVFFAFVFCLIFFKCLLVFEIYENSLMLENKKKNEFSHFYKDRLLPFNPK